MLKLKLRYFGYLMRRTNSLEKTLMLGKIEGGRRRAWQMRSLDDSTDSMDMSLSKLWELAQTRPLNWWCQLTIQSSLIPFSSCLQSFPASGSSKMSQFFTLGGQSMGVSSSASVLPMNFHDWFPWGLTGLISLKSKGLSGVFSNTTVHKHQFLALSFLYSPVLTSIHDNNLLKWLI